MWDLEWDEHGPRGPLGPICGFTTYFVQMDYATLEHSNKTDSV